MNVLDRLARLIVLRVLAHTRHGELVLVEDGERSQQHPRLGRAAPERLRFGQITPARPLRAVVLVHSPRFYRSLLHGSVGLCESYMQGLWDCEDLVALTRVAALNVRVLDELRRALAPVLIPFQRWLRWLARNTPRRSRAQIAAHYDLGNELFSLFLDPTMMYSCAFFPTPTATLQEASLAKLELVCARLQLDAEDHVLEIGSGWGGFAVYAAEHYGCRVTTTTISREQHAYASQRVREAGLQDRVTVLLADYRDRGELDLRGGYDKLVSIEMIEAVGWQYLDTYFRRCSELLAHDGAMLLQAIVIDDRAYHVEKASKSFINTYIFPGGCLPSLEAISRSLARTTDLRQVHLQDITSHYAYTLAHWRRRFLAASEHLSELGYDERFRRLWELYLSYCEGGFRERRIQDLQLLLAKPGYRGERRLPIELTTSALSSPPLSTRVPAAHAPAVQPQPPAPFETLSLSASSTK
jgi:cyclopropane-fatty-acyl-phospholipid synthase